MQVLVVARDEALVVHHLPRRFVDDVDPRASLGFERRSWGERVVLRLLEKENRLLNLSEMGFSQERLGIIQQLIQLSHGIILVTGPTGSGKTTTLYAALTHINAPDKNIITVEDPVEYQLLGVGQMQVNPKINLTFAAGLRSILRQDPDVIMIGEIRDRETAEIAIHASLTGHLVFSTLHTNDAASAATRLIDMGIEPFLVASSVVAVLAQRLLRQVCSDCKQPYHPDDEELIRLGAYRPGSSPEVDEAIGLHPALEAFLAQNKAESTSLIEGYQRLAAIVATPAASPPSGSHVKSKA